MCFLFLKFSLVVATIQKIYVFDLSTLTKQQEYSTYENEYGLVAINKKVMVIPDKGRGALRILARGGLLSQSFRCIGGTEGGFLCNGRAYLCDRLQAGAPGTRAFLSAGDLPPCRGPRLCDRRHRQEQYRRRARRGGERRLYHERTDDVRRSCRLCGGTARCASIKQCCGCMPSPTAHGRAKRRSLSRSNARSRAA